MTEVKTSSKLTATGEVGVELGFGAELLLEVL